MENITITVFVNKDSLLKILGYLKTLDSLPVGHEYCAFDAEDFKYSLDRGLNQIQLNLSTDLYLKWYVKIAQLNNINHDD